MKKLLTSLIIFFAVGTAQAERAYVTDMIKFTLRAAENPRSKIIKMLPSGTALTTISENKETGYTKVRLNDDIEGYILTRQLLPHPTNSWYRNKAEKQLETLKAENEKFQAELKALKADKSGAIDSNNKLMQERDSLSKELTDLKNTAANAIQLKQQRDQLQEHVVSVERELQKVKRDNQTLEDSSNQDWFLRGGMLALVGVFMGFIIPKISWRRRTSNWDTF